MSALAAYCLYINRVVSAAFSPTDDRSIIRYMPITFIIQTEKVRMKQYHETQVMIIIIIIIIIKITIVEKEVH